MAPTKILEGLLTALEAQPSMAGALIWSLRQHNYEGGFYW